MNPAFWRDRRVLVTGHTGFKGSWLCLLLERLGAETTGYSLDPATEPAMFDQIGPWLRLRSVIGDVTDATRVEETVAEAAPEVVIHMASQAIVRASYDDPVRTFATNVLGTVNVLEALRSAPSVGVVLVVTSDKVYQQEGDVRPFVENDRLGGSDPYSASKSAQELVAASYSASFLEPAGVRVATARSGNVIGGGDWSPDRLVPDLYRAIGTGRPVQLRYPDAVRPWQHVLDPLVGYLSYVEHLHGGGDTPLALNFGPDFTGTTVADVIERLAELAGMDAKWEHLPAAGKPEHAALILDAAAAAKTLDWRPLLSIDQALEWTAAWYGAHAAGHDLRHVSRAQIDDFFELRI